MCKIVLLQQLFGKCKDAFLTINHCDMDGISERDPYFQISHGTYFQEAQANLLSEKKSIEVLK